jgi:hypothetical protein
MEAQLGAEAAGEISFEVSSPGAERTLILPQDLMRFKVRGGGAGALKYTGHISLVGNLSTISVFVGTWLGTCGGCIGTLCAITAYKTGHWKVTKVLLLTSVPES